MFEGIKLARKEKDTKEFFEVFKQPKEQRSVKYSEIRRPQARPGVYPGSDSKVIENDTGGVKEKGPLGWIRDTKDKGPAGSYAQSARKLFLNTITVKQETLILVGLGATFLALVCFFTGHKVGYNKALDLDTPQESTAQFALGGGVKSVPQGKKIGAVDLTEKPSNTASKEVQDTKWTLQIITYSNTKKNLKKAGNLAKAIKDMTGYNTFVAKRGNELVVCAGRFNSKNGSKTKKALDEISHLEYEGKKQFASSYPIQIK